ncbi:TraI domain-containing protein [Oceanimonas sp. NS1]|nr:TraI domain-containing protein [Oceanimonas sp. NS1]
MLAELNGQDEQCQLGLVQTLPAVVGRQQVERQLAWLPEPQQSLLMDVWSMLAVIDDEVLQNFLLDILSNDAIMAPFCQSQASHRHHHDQRGGLLAHSHEVAMTAAMLSSQYGLGQRSIWVAFVGGLLHDIGKIRLYYNENTGTCGQHESLNFMVLGQQLEQLRLVSPKMFEALSACLEARVGKYADPYQVANIVRMCDRLSADVSNWKMPSPGYRRISGTPDLPGTSSYTNGWDRAWLRWYRTGRDKSARVFVCGMRPRLEGISLFLEPALGPSFQPIGVDIDQ